MAFTPEELAHISALALDYYLKGSMFHQSIQAKPLIGIMEQNRTTFPGGKENISIGVKGVYGNNGVNDGLAGYTHDDTVRFYTPKNALRAEYPWRETHIGIGLTHTELKIDGLTVIDDATPNMGQVRRHSKREATVLAGILDTALHDLGERYATTLNDMFWGDGSADPLGFHGLKYFISATPAVGTVGGIDRSVAGNEWWQNRASLGITSSPANGGALLQELQKEYRQLVRYGGRPRNALCGSDFLDAMEIELRANGNYTDNSFANSPDSTRFDMPSVRFLNQTFQYDPTLDDIGEEKFCYWWDSRNLRLDAMEDEWNKTHTPARPPDQFVMYRSITCTGQVIGQQCNSSGVYSIA